jgi:antitoxin (DNA-binding transcriptional repressor) of toxin-antitoxin stability system
MKIRESDISATEAARNLSDLINRVVYRGEEFLVQRGGEPVCRISPVRYAQCSVAALSNFLRYVPGPDAEYWDELAAAADNDPCLP